MRDIDELISNVTLREEDYENIEPIPLDYEAYNNIINNTLKGIEDVRAKEKGDMPKKKKKGIRLLLVAAILALSTTILATTKVINIQEIFMDIFGESTANIGDSGQVVNSSVTEQRVELNLEGLVSDENTVDLVFNIRKESGKPFVGECISFEEFTVETETAPNYKLQAGITGSTYCQEIDTITPNSAERRFRLTNTAVDDIKNGEAILRLTNIIESEKITLVSDLNLGEWMRENVQDITLVSNNDIRLNTITDPNIIAELNIPSKRITSTDAKLQLFKDDDAIRINSIGFVNNQLHIKSRNTQNSLYFQDTNGHRFDPIYIASDAYNGYYVFDISTIEELEGLKAYADISRVVNTINGTWEIKFDLNTQNQKMILQPDVTVPLSGNRNLRIRELQLSKLSLVLCSPNFSGTINIEIKFKDNRSSLQLNGAYVSTHTDKEKCLIYKFDEPIDISAVDTIIINGTPIALE